IDYDGKPLTSATRCYWKVRVWDKDGNAGPYSGTAILSHRAPLSVQYGLPTNLSAKPGTLKSGEQEPNRPDQANALDQEGRVITLEFQDFYLVNVYTPNSQNELKRLTYRHKTWDPAFRRYLLHLEQHKPVLFCGDLNVAHKPIDLARPKENERSPGFTQEEREGLNALLDSGYDDSFRLFCEEPNQYSWWSYRANARAKNVGWRIDYVCTSQRIRDKIKTAEIHQDVFGSDHCPVSITLKRTLKL
ncbi:MAG: exodeoxyribonuclease III, partial [Gammaproteobacteria bacterium]